MADPSARPSLLELFGLFARISAVTIGGGYVMLPLMKRELVDARGWLSDVEMVDYYALGQSIPGIIAMNTAALVGYRKRGLPGSAAAAAGMALPSLLIIMLIAAFLAPYFEQAWVLQAFAGIRAAVVAMIGMALWQILKTSVNSLSRGVIAIASFVAIAGLSIHPVLMIVAGGLLGTVLFRKEAGA